MKKGIILTLSVLGLCITFKIFSQTLSFSINNTYSSVSSVNRVVVSNTVTESLLIDTNNSVGGYLVIPACNLKSGYTISLRGFGFSTYTGNVRYRLRLVPVGQAITNGVVLIDTGMNWGFATTSQTEYALQFNYNGATTNNVQVGGYVNFLNVATKLPSSVTTTPTIDPTVSYIIAPTVEHDTASSNNVTSINNWLIMQAGRP